MGLDNVVLPKKYKNGETLFEQNLDDWRRAAEAAFNNMNLNLHQLGLDAFGASYQFNNDGQQSQTSTILQDIYNIITGVTPITGTKSDTFTINTDGNSATLSTTSLTADRTFTFPDISGTFMMLEGAQSVSGVKTFNADVNFADTRVVAFNMATGTAPFTVASTTKVTNLHAETADSSGALTITNDVATATAVYPTWVNANSGNIAIYVSSANLSFVPSTGVLTALGFSGPLTGNVTGNVTGSVSGNSGTVTNGFYTTSSFNLGTTSIAVNRASAPQSLTGISIDGSSGSCTGNANTATTATTANTLAYLGVLNRKFYKLAVSPNVAFTTEFATNTIPAGGAWISLFSLPIGNFISGHILVTIIGDSITYMSSSINFFWDGVNPVVTSVGGNLLSQTNWQFVVGGGVMNFQVQNISAVNAGTATMEINYNY